MAEFHFYGSNEDGLRALRAVLAPGDVRVIPDRKYPSTEPASYGEVSDALVESIVNGVLYIIGDFSKCSVRFLTLRDEVPGGKYFIDPTSSGGPIIKFKLPMCKKRDDVLWHLGPGHVFHQRQLWDDATRSFQSQSAALKSAYAEIIRRVKSVSHRRTVGAKRFWIGDEGWNLLRSDEALILISGKWLDKDGTLIKSNLRRS